MNEKGRHTQSIKCTDDEAYIFMQMFSELSEESRNLVKSYLACVARQDSPSLVLDLQEKGS